MNDQEILKTRARDLARPLSSEREQGGVIDIVEFRLAQERYALEQKFIRAVCPLKQLTPLPCTPAFLLGIVNIRGQIVPVIDIKKFFELPETGITDLHVVIIVHADGAELGILADAIAGAHSVPLAMVQPSLPTLTGIRGEYLKGVTDQHLVILDASRILGDQKLVVNEEVEGGKP